MGGDRAEDQRLYEIADRHVSPTAPNINRFWANLIVEELIRNGVRRFFIAPGSRSAPLVAAVAQHPGAEAVLHFDERGTAFAALGFARATRQPAVWITTSGTAVANGLPAFVEASQSYVPLIALTADRPPELRDTGANQAIDQVRIFGTYARWFFDLPCPSAGIDPAFVLSAVDQAVHRAVDAPPGPVHLNCAYREPLAPSVDGEQMPELPMRWSGSHEPYTTYRSGVLDPDPMVFEKLAERLANTRRGLLVVGELPSLETALAVSSLASGLGWPVLADVTSQMRLGDAGAPLVASPHFTCYHMTGGRSPEIILRMGGPISSKDIQHYLDTAPERLIFVTDRPARRDPGHRIAEVIRASTESFCRMLEGVASNIEPEWGMSWIETGRRISRRLGAEVGALTTLSEPGTAASLTGLLPADHALFVASSMPIRDVDMFGAARGPLRRVAANRGASGIDGTVASAFGYHLGAGVPLTLFTGDLALLHDLNSLALLAGRPIVVVVINNRGGGIFNFLPIAEHAEVFEPWFTAPHRWSFEHAAAMFDLRFDCPETVEEFETAYAEAVASGQATLIEIQTDRHENRLLHATLRDQAKPRE